MSQFTPRFITGLIWAAGLLSACDETATSNASRPPIEPVKVSHALSAMDSCEDYVSYAKESAIERMTAMVEQNCQSMLEAVSYRDSVGYGKASPSSVDGAMAPAMDESAGQGEFSVTNTQEQGVDEADFVKTDGAYLYVATGQELVVVSISETGELTETGRLSLTGYPTELYLYHDKAVVFSNLSETDVPNEMRVTGAPNTTTILGENHQNIEPPMVDESPDMGYNFGSYTQISVIDLSDKSAPTLLRATQYAGRYVSSRRIDGMIRTVLSSPTSALNVPTHFYLDYWDMPELKARKEINAACDELIEKNTAYINGLSENDILPKKSDSQSGAVEDLTSCTDIFGPATPAGNGLLSVISVDIDSPSNSTKAISVVGQEGHVYASETALYLTTAPDYVQMAFGAGLWAKETSGIHKFNIADSEKPSYAGSGTVTGHLLNQFSLGEYQDHLRVATTSGNGFSMARAIDSDESAGNTLDNHIFILKESANKLEITGSLSGIGTGEEIYAVRFMGERGFVVTFYQTDPLFTLDLSNPENPTVVGEWLGPGYSTYLHPFGDRYIVAMGVDENWRTGISLYDLSKYDSPTLIERQPLLGRNYQTAALYEHKAFTFNPATGDLLLPYYDYDSDTGVLRYNVNENGIDLLGQMPSEGSLSVEGPIRRAMYNNDILIGVGACRITTAAMDTPSAPISSLPIYKDACIMPGWYY